MKIKILIFISLTFLFTALSVAQRPNAGYTDYSKLDNSNNLRNDSLVNSLDSLLPPFEYKYFYINDFTKILVNGDTTLDNEFKESEPTRRKKFYDLNTGNAGSASNDAVFNFKPKAGFHSGYDQYNVYNLSLDKFKFYDSERTLADLRFAFIFGSQNNFIVGADFGQKFKSGVSLSLNYNRVSQLGTYASQETKSTAFGLGLKYETLKQKLIFLTGVISNTNNEAHNGGIKNLDAILTAPFKSNVPVFLTDARSRFDYKDIFFQSRYNLDGKASTSSSLSLGYHFQYHYGYNRFSDVEVSGDSSFYRKFWIEGRGLRNNNNISILTNEFYLFSKLSWTNAKISLVYDKINIEQESKRNSINDVSLKFNGIINFKRNLNINAKAVLGLGNNAGTFTVDGNTEIKLGKFVNLNGDVSFFRSQVAWKFSLLRLNDIDFYNNDFVKPFGSNLAAGVNINPLHLSVKVGQSLINNFLYFDSLSQPKQFGSIFSHNYVSISHKLKFWKIGFENDILFQNINADLMAIPGQMIRSNLYFESFVFKKNLLLRIGAELRYLPKFETPVFNPVLGNYYKGNGIAKDDYLFGDIYILGQVAGKFRIFVKIENANAMFVQKINYLAYRSPQFGNYLRLGFRWLLLD